MLCVLCQSHSWCVGRWDRSALCSLWCYNQPCHTILRFPGMYAWATFLSIPVSLSEKIVWSSDKNTSLSVMWILDLWIFDGLSFGVSLLAHSMMFHVHFCFRVPVFFLLHLSYSLHFAALWIDVQSVFAVRWYMVSCFVTLTQFFLSLWLSFVLSFSFPFSMYFDYYYCFVCFLCFVGGFLFGSPWKCADNSIFHPLICDQVSQGNNHHSFVW